MGIIGYWDQRNSAKLKSEAAVYQSRIDASKAEQDAIKAKTKAAEDAVKLKAKEDTCKKESIRAEIENGKLAHKPDPVLYSICIGGLKESPKQSVSKQPSPTISISNTATMTQPQRYVSESAKAEIQNPKPKTGEGSRDNINGLTTGSDSYEKKLYYFTLKFINRQPPSDFAYPPGVETNRVKSDSAGVIISNFDLPCEKVKLVVENENREEMYRADMCEVKDYKINPGWVYSVVNKTTQVIYSKNIRD